MHMKGTKVSEELKEALIIAAGLPPMTPQEIEAQRQSWVRGMTRGCEHGVLDFEQCSDCRNQGEEG